MAVFTIMIAFIGCNKDVNDEDIFLISKNSSIITEGSNMKYIIFSFDDGGKGIYEHAYKLMLKYGIKASMHINTKFIEDEHPNYISLEEAFEMRDSGFDFSSHSHGHVNEKNDLAISLSFLKKWGLADSINVVFSSPNSEIYEGNLSHFNDMLENNGITHVRTGTQVRRNGIFYSGIYLCQKFFKSKHLFYHLNKNNLHKINESTFFIKSVSIKKYNTVKQLEYIVNRLNKGDVVVFLLHNIVPEKEMKKSNLYWFSAEKFEEFLQIITNKEDIEIITINDYISR